MGGAAVAVVRWQVAPVGAGAEYPEHGVAEAAVVVRRPAHFAGAAGKQWGQDVPGAVRRCRGDDR